MDCRETIWRIDCESCGHDIPIIGKLARFDDSDLPGWARILNWLGRTLFPRTHPS